MVHGRGGKGGITADVKPLRVINHDFCLRLTCIPFNGLEVVISVDPAFSAFSVFPAVLLLLLYNGRKLLSKPISSASG